VLPKGRYLTVLWLSLLAIKERDNRLHCTRIQKSQRRYICNYIWFVCTYSTTEKDERSKWHVIFDLAMMMHHGWLSLDVSDFKPVVPWCLSRCCVVRAGGFVVVVAMQHASGGCQQDIFQLHRTTAASYCSCWWCVARNKRSLALCVV